MGQSQNPSDKNPELINNEYNEKKFDHLREYSSYKGIRSESDSFHVKKCTNEETESRRSDFPPESQNELVEVTFIWKEGGNDVFITGTFSDWKQWLSLEKIGDSFRLKILLPREKHLFKFIVDKQWVCSKNYSSETDEYGNTNNFIDLNAKKEEKPKKEVIRTAPTERSRKQSLPSQNADSFSEVKPERSDLNTDSPAIPGSYEHNFDINDLSVQEKKGKRHYLNWESEKRMGDHQYDSCNKSMKTIPSKPHVNM